MNSRSNNPFKVKACTEDSGARCRRSHHCGGVGVERYEYDTVTLPKDQVKVTVQIDGRGCGASTPYRIDVFNGSEKILDKIEIGLALKRKGRSSVLNPGRESLPMLSVSLSPKDMEASIGWYGVHFRGESRN